MLGGSNKSYTFVVEHLDPELGPWSELEYKCIAQESSQAGCEFILTSVDPSLKALLDTTSWEGVQVKSKSVESIYSNRKERVCLLDPQAKDELCPADHDNFDVFLFGGILGDDPPRDRTAELRHRGFQGRRLGPKQMTTDTAVRVTRMVALNSVPLDKIPYVDFPELKLDEHERTEMPFRYVSGADGKPIMPKGMLELIKEDADKGLEDFISEQQANILQ